MKRSVIIVAAIAAVLVTVAGAWKWSHMRMAALTSAELAQKVHAPPAPARLKEGCPEVMQALAASSSGSERGKPAKSISPLSEDEIAIYRAVLERRLSQGWASLHVSAKTYPFEAEPLRGSVCECLQDIYLEGSSLAFHSFHALPPDVLPGKRMKLVDPQKQAAIVRANDPDKTMAEGKTVDEVVRDAEATGLFSLSEVVFDKEHRHAVVSYSYRCGALCGSGSTLVFEKIGGQWKNTNRKCGGWIS